MRALLNFGPDRRHYSDELDSLIVLAISVLSMRVRVRGGEEDRQTREAHNGNDVALPCLIR